MISEKTELSKYFEDGIHFSCLKCGECCKGLNDGEVYLYREDIERLVEYLNKNGQKYTLKSFCQKYVKVISTTFYWREPKATRGKNYSLKTLGFKFIGDDEHCPFIDENDLCTVHEARPFQCRAYPIGWNMLIKNTRNFRKYAKDCPGLRESINQHGKFYSRQEVVKWAKKEYQIEKDFFLEMKKKKFDIYKVYKYLSKNKSSD